MISDSPQRAALEELVRWLEDEAEKRMKSALARKDSGRIMCAATVAELKSAKSLAEKMAGHKLHGISTTTESSKSYGEMQLRIADKAETEARRLSDWADLVRQLIAQLTGSEL